MSIASNCMTCNISIGAWSGQRLDKAASAKVTSEAGAASDAARVNKHLVPKESLQPIATQAGKLRDLFKTLTLPWKDNGDRLLTRKGYAIFVEKFSAAKREFDEAVEHFVSAVYPQDIARAEFRMGELFKAEDFPVASDLRRRFYVTLDIGAVTEAGDFRVALSDDEVTAIQERIERENSARIANAMSDVWSRLSETLQHFASTMADENKVFRDTTVYNLTEIVELIPALNIMNDQHLNDIYVDIKDTLVGLSPKDLRKNTDVRSAAASEAKRICDEMAGFMGAFNRA